MKKPFRLQDKRMKTINWKPYLYQYIPEEHSKIYIPFKYNYAIRQTRKAILFKLPNHITVFVPKSVLKVDHEGLSNIGKKGWVYIHKDFLRTIISKNPEQDFSFIGDIK